MAGALGGIGGIGGIGGGVGGDDDAFKNMAEEEDEECTNGDGDDRPVVVERFCRRRC